MIFHQFHKTFLSSTSFHDFPSVSQNFPYIPVDFLFNVDICPSPQFQSIFVMLTPFVLFLDLIDKIFYLSKSHIVRTFDQKI